MTKKNTEFFSGGLYDSKIVDEFNAIADQIDNPSLVQIAEHEFDITSCTSSS